jgi:hypothetical protein
MKTYLVQTWDKQGARTNHYDVLIDSPRELAELKKFLRSKHGQVLITLNPPSAAKKSGK